MNYWYASLVPSSTRLADAEIAASLRLSATRLARRLRQEAHSGLTPSQLSALATVAHHGPLTLGALAEREAVAPPSITKVVAILEAEGLVQRTPDPTDRRSSHLQTTATGNAFIAEDRRRRTAWLAAQVATLSDDDRRRLADALDVLDRLTALDAEGPKDQP